MDDNTKPTVMHVEGHDDIGSAAAIPEHGGGDAQDLTVR